MGMSHELRLQSMLRAMNEVIIPAIDPKAQLAIDQANILVGNLRILLDQHDREYEFRMVELREFAALTRALLDAASGGDETEAARAQAKTALAAAGPVTALEMPSQGALTAMVRALRGSADALLRAAHADGDPAFKAAAQVSVMMQGKKEISRERVWVREARFEADPEALPSLESVLSLD